MAYIILDLIRSSKEVHIVNSFIRREFKLTALEFGFIHTTREITFPLLDPYGLKEIEKVFPTNIYIIIKEEKYSIEIEKYYEILSCILNL